MGILGLNSLVVGSTVLVAHSIFVLVGLWWKIFNWLAIGWDWGRGSIGTDWCIVWDGDGNGSSDKGEEDEEEVNEEDKGDDHEERKRLGRKKRR